MKRVVTFIIYPQKEARRVSRPLIGAIYNESLFTSHIAEIVN